MADLSSRLDRLTPQQRAALEQRLQEKRAARQGAGEAGIVPQPRVPNQPAAFPLSFAQERLWFLDQLEPGLSAYNVPGALRLPGDLDVGALAASLAEIVRRHEPLRTTFAPGVQVVAPAARLELPLVDLSGLGERVEGEARLRIAAEESRPFDLGRGPLFRPLLLRLAPQDHLLLVVMHHIVSDGWSLGLLLRELSVLYEAYRAGRPSPLPALPVQYADFAAWQRERLSGEILERELGYWRGQLAGLPPRLELPTDRPRPATQTYRGASRPVQIRYPLLSRLRTLAVESGATLFMVLLAGFAALLSRLSDEEDLAVGTPVAGRLRGETEGLIGLFVNTLVIRAALTGDPSFAEALRRIQAATLGAFSHQELPFEKLVEELAPQRSLAHSPLFQVMLVLHNAPPEATVDGAPGPRPVPIEGSTVKFDLNLSLMDMVYRLEGRLEFNRDLFDAPTAARLVEQLAGILEAVATDPSRPLSTLPLLTEAQRHQSFIEWNEGAGALGRGFEPQPVHHLIPAGNLRLAHQLRRLGVGPGQIVGLFLERSNEAVEALLGIWKAGAAFVPLDPGLPKERLAYLLADTGAAAVVTRPGLAGSLPPWGGTVVTLDELEGEDPQELPFSGPDDLAYVLYTSGSTGAPKGVMVPHGALSRYALWARDTYGAGGGGTLLHTSLAFDLTLTSLLVPLLTGGRIQVVPEEAGVEGLGVALTESRDLAFLKLTPSHARLLGQQLAPRDLARRARALILGGESLAAEDLAPWREADPEVWVHNEYGPTETVVGCCVHSVRAGELADGPVPIGRPIPGVRLYVVDRRGEPCPIGVPGELWIGGPALAWGYLGRPDLTAERFLPDSGNPVPGTRAYRTGDRVRHRTNGVLEYLGRTDHQIKLRGFRIEPGEIEEALRAHPAVREAAVATVDPGSGGLRLAAFVVSEDGTVPPDLRSWLQGRLPAYMVPPDLFALASLPLNANGKVDRRALAALAPGALPAGPAEGPRTPVEDLLAGIWEEVLRRDRVGAGDDFFALGGHSLLAAQVASRVRAVFGVEMPLRALFEQPTLAGLAAWIEARRAEQGSAPPPPLAPVPRNGNLPLSFSQQRLWFLDRLLPGNVAYNVPCSVRIEGALAPAVLEASLAEVVRRHEALRTRFPAREGRPVQEVLPTSGFLLPRVDLSGLPPAAREAEGLRLTAEEARRPFDLARGPLLRAALVRLGTDDHLLLLTLHHIVSDGWSAGVLLREMAALYTASPLPPLPVQYADYAAWQRQWLQGEALESHLAFWRERLEDPPVLDLPTDRPRPPVPALRGASRALPLSGTLTAALRHLARGRGSSLFMVALTAWQALLARYTGQSDLLTGTAVANRNRPEVEGLIGFFVNTLVLRTRLEGDPAFAEAADRVREEVLAAFAHAELPFEKLVEEIHPRRDTRRNPLFQVSLVLQNQDRAAAGVTIPGLTLRPVEADPGGAKLDLALLLFEGETGVLALAEYATELFDAPTVQRLLEHYRTLLEGAAADPGRRISELPLLAAGELAQVLLEWNDTAAPEPGAALAYEPIVAAARRTPDALAAVWEAGALTYAELERRSNQLARHLQRLGVGPESRVLLSADRSGETLVGLLAVLKAGGAYVPLDPAYPPERIAQVAADAGAGLLLTAERRAGLIPAGGLRPVTLDSTDLEVLAQDESPLPAAAFPQSPAYVIYTSGSTGRPKGVVISHGGLVRSTEARLAFYSRPVRGYLLASSFAFDSSVAGLFWTLWQGGTLILPAEDVVIDPPRLVRWMDRHRASHLLCLPSLYQLILGAAGPDQLADLDTVIVAGEACPAALIARHAEKRPGVGLFNEYGPTEATVWASACALRPGPDAPVPIGRPILGLQDYILDAGLAPLPAGVPGELWIGGETLARGYFGRPDLTAERFRPDPFGGCPGGRLYRTGDRTRFRPDGQIDYLGRIDHQVKVRGVRVELEEIEAVLAAHPEVREAAVAVREEGRTGARLVAYVAPAGLSAASLREWLRARLPEAMVPAAFVVLESLPRTPNGKVDRRALPAPAPATTAGVAPVSGLEGRLAAVWATVLGLERVGVDDSFFDLGGHSLLLVELQEAIRAAVGVEVPLLDLFQFPTVRALAGRLAGVQPAAEPEAAPSPAPAGTPIAVIGLAGRFPGAATPDELWANLCAGIESVVDLSEEQLRAAGVPAEQIASPNYVRRGTVLDGIDLFDAPFFGYSPREAEALDPQQRLFLQVAWSAIEDAGYDPRAAPGPVGVFASSQASSYMMNVLSRPDVVAAVGSWGVHHGLDKDYLPTRVSYELDLKGPSVAVQTACSSSLVAVHYACRALVAGECRMALAGGADVKVPQGVGYLYEEGGIASPDGSCRAFDAQARGTFGGSGVAAVVLKRLEDALRDGDTIRAVIRGSAVSNDGAVKIGFTAPGVEGQAAAIAAAQAAAGVSPDTVQYVEAHGTGTPLGDPIEVAALTRAFRARGVGGMGGIGRTGFCALGSLKTNIGHLDSAAGIAGLVKTVLALQHRLIPPSLHFERPNPQIDFASSPFYVAQSLQGWPEPPAGTPRRAGVSSFGIGGTNVHVVLEEAPQQAAPGTGRSWQLLPLSARTPAALDAATERLGRHLADHPDLPLPDVAWTLQAGRRAFEHRRVLVATGTQDAAAVLLGGDPERLLSGRWEGARRPVAFLFPGQGAQHPDMGRGLYGEEPAFRQALDACADHLAPRLGRDLRDLLFPAPDRREEAARELRDTRFAQPALFAVEYALAQVWLSWGVTPWALIGHSVGEYVAACLAGVFSLQDGLDLIAARGELMSSLPAGAMLSVDLPEADLSALLPDGVSLAAVNGPESSVASGPEEGIAKLEERLAGVASRRLQTSHAFHSAMMDPVLAAFRERVERVALRPPSLPYLSNLTGDWITEAEATDPEYWVRHLRGTVRFGDGIARLLPEAPVLLEVGPGRTLSTLVRGTARAEGSGAAVVASLRHPKDEAPDAASLVEAAGRLWLAGAEIDWRAFHRGEPRRRLPLPAYPFEPRRYWLDRQAAPARETGRPGLVLLGGDEGARRLGGTLREAGWTVETVTPPPASRQAYGDLLAALSDRGFEPAGVVELGASAPDGEASLGLLVRVQSLERRAEAAAPEPKPEPAAHDRPDLATPYEAPRNETESHLARIWGDLFGIGRVGVHDDFFDLGGHSLLATRALGRIREALRVELPLDTLFTAPTVARLAARIEEQRSRPAAASIRIPPAPRTADLPLSFAQQQIWVVQELEPGSPAYNLPSAFRLRGPLDAAAVTWSFGQVVARHEVLRTAFPAVQGWPVQRIAHPAETPLPWIDLSALEESRREREAAALRVADALRPFDLARGPLFRAALVRLDPDDHLLQLNFHHIVFDGWSWGVLFGELAALYEARRAGRSMPLPPLPIQYADFAAWQRGRAEEVQRQLDYWRERLAGLEPLGLSPEPPRGSRAGGAAERFTLDAALMESLRVLGQAQGSTLFMVLLALFQVLLHQRTGREDIAVGSPVAGRLTPEVEGLIGDFVNTVVLRTSASGDPAFRELLARVRETTLGAHSHQEVPFEQVVAALREDSGEARPRLFEVWFVLHNTPTPSLALPGLTAASVPVDGAAPRHDLNFSLWPGPGGLSASLEYRTDRFTAAAVRRMAEDFAVLAGMVARAVSTGSEVRLSALAAGLSEADREVQEARKQAARAAGIDRLKAKTRRVAG